MKRFLTAFVTVLLLSGALSASASATRPHIYPTARAIPTKSGEFVRLTLYTKHTRRLLVSVLDGGGSLARSAKEFGRGCGERNCQKWKIYFRPREEDVECYDLNLVARNRRQMDSIFHTVCEPFPDGSV